MVDLYTHLSLGAFGLWMLAGTWTSAYKSLGFVTDAAVEELDSDSNGSFAAELVEKGAWTRQDGGYRMEYGPSADWPLPIWRYDDGAPANGLFEVVLDPEPRF